MRTLRLVGVVCLLALFGALALEAQIFTGTIRGTVTDPAGAAIPGAGVTVINADTGLARTTSTNEAGEYVFPQLPLGAYRIEVTKEGFKKAIQTGISLHVAEVAVINVSLAVGAVIEEITVQAEATAVETQSGEIGGLIGGTQVRELPLNGRSFAQLTQLMPGVAAGDSFDPKNKGLFSAIDMSISGGSSIGNLWTVDAANNNDVGSNRTVLIFPSIDAIEEFRIHRNAYGPEFGQSGGAQINIVTRSGKNEFHGSAYYFGRNDAVNAHDYFLNLAGQDKAKLRRNDFGYTIGGPIVRDRAFFFFSQEWNREKRGTVRTTLVPTAAEKRGDFSAPFLSGCVPANPSARIPLDPRADPSNPVPFGGGTNIMQPADISPAGALYVQLYPDANIAPSAADPCPFPNWVSAITVPVNWREESIRGDFNINDKTTLMVRYTHDSWVNPAPTAGDANGLWGDDPFPTVDSDWDQPGHMFVIKLSRTFGTTAVNDFQFSWSGNRIFIERGLGEQLNSAINAAIPPMFPNAAFPDAKAGGADRAHMTFWGGQGYEPLWHIAPWDNKQDLLIWKDDYSKVFRSHTFRAGFLMSRNRKDEDIGGASAFEAGEVWGPTGVPAWGEPTWGPTTGNNIADFLLKDMLWGYDENNTEPRNPVRWRDYEFYFGDTWRLRGNLTINYGLRWSFLREPFTADNRITNFVPSLFDPALGADPCNGLIQPPGTTWCQDAGFLGGQPGPNRALRRNANNLVAPRFGIAWDPTGAGKMAIRAGVGQFFARNRIHWLDFGNPPFAVNIGSARHLDLDPNTDPGAVIFSAAGPSGGYELTALVPNNWQWNLTIERELWRNTKLEVGYVGSRGIHLLSILNANQVLPGDRDASGVDDRLEFARACAVGDCGARADLRPFGVFGNSNITLFGRAADSIYHSLQTYFTSRFQRNSLFQFAYTWSKLLSTDPLAGSFNLASAFVDNTNFELDRGPSAFNRPHVFSANLVYNLPILEGYNQFIRHVFGNWEVGTIVIFATGPSLTVDNVGAPDFSGTTGQGSSSRPNRVAGAGCRATTGPKHQWLNPAGWTYEGFQLGTIGNSPRGVCSGPGNNNWDIAFYKTVPVKEKVQLQFRFELFNAFNHLQFRSVVTGLGASNPQYDTGDPATANSVVSFDRSPTFGRAGRTRGPREIQYAIKIIW